MAVNAEPTTAELFGIAKRIALELEGLPMEANSFIVTMVAQSFQHRTMKAQRDAQQAEIDRALAREEREKKAADMIAAHREQLQAAKDAGIIVPERVNA